MSKHKYTLLYQLKPSPEGLTKEQIDEINKTRADDDQFSACDAGVFFSLLYPEDGSYSWLMLPVDGRPGAEEKQFELDDLEVFKCWAMLAHRLAMSKTLDSGKKELCAFVHQAMIDALRAAARRNPS